MVPPPAAPCCLVQAWLPAGGTGAGAGGAQPVRALLQALLPVLQAHGGRLWCAAWRGATTPGPGDPADTGLLMLYLQGVAASPALLAALQAAAPATAAAGDAKTAGGVWRVSPLQPVFHRAGAAAGDVARWHYVVETDPQPGWHDEIATWYDQEHMPGLAAVPGCVQALRALNHGHGPRSLACYDLVAPEVLGSPPWLAVRGTAWSSRTRPHFSNTRRTMFERVTPTEEPA